MPRRCVSLLCALLLASCAAVDSKRGDATLDKIKASGTITLGYREGAVPFSFLGKDDKPAGFSVDLCERVVEGLKTQLALPALKTNWVAVNADNRFQQVTSGQIDLECGTTSVTLTRQAEVDFSLMTFLDGGAFLTRPGTSPKTLGELHRLRVAVSTGTTTESYLRKALGSQKIQVEIVPVKSHAEGLALLRDGSVAAYASDRTVLIALALTAGQGSAFQLSEMMFSYEPYALMLRRDPDFRLAVNRVLAGIYRSGDIVGIYVRWFGSIGEPTDALKAMYIIQSLPE